MKTAKFVIEVITPILANSRGENTSIDRFQRDSDDQLVFQQSWWFSALTKAVDHAHIRGIKAADISVDLLVPVKTATFRRHYGDTARLHEAIMPGTTVEFKAMVSDTITPSNLRTILECLGSYIGLSPYGFKLGYGKFKLLSVQVGDDHESNKDNRPVAEPAGV